MNLLKKLSTKLIIGISCLFWFSQASFASIPLVWEFPLDTDADAFAPVVAQDGTIYFTQSDYFANSARVYAVKPDGTPKWTTPFTGLVRSELMAGIDGTLYLQLGTDYVALDIEGNEKWRFPLPATGAGFGEGVSYSAIDRTGNIYLVTRRYFSDPAGPIGENVYALDSLGKLRWDKSFVAPVIFGDGGQVFIWPPLALSSGGDVYAGVDQLRVFDSAGVEKWSANVRPVSAFAIDDEARVYFCGVATNAAATGTGSVFCYNRLGEMQWKAGVLSEAQPYAGPMITSEGNIVYPNHLGPQIFKQDGAVLIDGNNSGIGYAGVALLEGNTIAVQGALVKFDTSTITPTEINLFTMPDPPAGRAWFYNRQTVSSSGIAYFTATTGNFPGDVNRHGLYAFNVGKLLQDSPWPATQQNARRSGQVRASSVPPIVQPQLVIETAVALETPTVSGTLYQPQTSTNLTSWTDLGKTFVGNGGTVTNFVVASPRQALFFRVKVIP